MRITSIERYLRDLLIGDHLPDRRCARLHKSGVRCDLHLLGNLADLKDDVNFGPGIDLEDNSRLHVRLEAG